MKNKKKRVAGRLGGYLNFYFSFSAKEGGSRRKKKPFAGAAAVWAKTLERISPFHFCSCKLVMVGVLIMSIWNWKYAKSLAKCQPQICWTIFIGWVICQAIVGGIVLPLTLFLRFWFCGVLVLSRNLFYDFINLQFEWLLLLKLLEKGFGNYGKIKAYLKCIHYGDLKKSI